MTQQLYGVGLINGNKFQAHDVDLKQVKEALVNPKTFSVQLGPEKSIKKDAIAFVAKAEATEEKNKNICVDVGVESLYYNVDDTSKEITHINDTVNKNAWVMLNDSILFNRGFYVSAQKHGGLIE